MAIAIHDLQSAPIAPVVLGARPRPVIAYGLCGAITVEMPLADLTATIAYNRHEERGQVDVALEPEPPLWHMSSQLSRVADAVRTAWLDCRSGDDAAIRALHEAYWRVLLYREGWREAVEGDGATSVQTTAGG